MPPTGPEQWSHKLSPRQRRLLEGLPVAAPTERSVMAAREAAFTLFFAEVPPIAATAGVTWPHDLEAAVKAYLAREGLPLPGGDHRYRNQKYRPVRSGDWGSALERPLPCWLA